MKSLQFLFAVIILLASCKTEEKPVTKEQAALFAQSIERSIAGKDEIFFNNAFDMDAMVAKMKAAAPDEPGSFWKGVKEGIGEKLKLGNKVLQSLGSKGSYKLVKQYQQGAKLHLIFRLYSEGGGLNYHDFELVNKKDNVKIADMYIYTTGELFSKTMKDVFTQILKANDKSLSGLEKLGRLIQKGEYKKAKELLDDLPQNLKNTKAIQLRNIQLCLELDTAAYATALNKFQQDFPDDPSLNLVLLDNFITKEKYAEALNCINQLDKQISKDPLLDYHRGLLYNLQGKKEAALQAFESLYKNMPEFSAGAMELCTYYMDKGNYKQAGEIFKKAKTNTDFDKSVAENLQLRYPQIKKYTGD
jgi:Flp pilus assembly protein TadD